MIIAEYLIARRLANLYWSGFNSASGPYLLLWSQFRDLSVGKVLANAEIEEVAKFLLRFGFVMAKCEEGIIVWHRISLDPREISELKLHKALQLISEEDELEIENELSA